MSSPQEDAALGPTPSTRRLIERGLESRADAARRLLTGRWYYNLFLFLSTLCAFAEPVLIAFPTQPTLVAVQLYVLAASSGLFFVGVALTAAFIHDEHESLPLLVRVFDVFDGEVFMELLLIGLGWICIYNAPGLAAFRCFRVFRYLWYFELLSIKRGNVFFFVAHASRLCVVYLQKLYEELFTSRSKGAVVVLGIFFFMAYVYGVVFWTITRDWSETRACDTLVHCMWVMMRLTFYDNEGLDFVKVMLDSESKGYAVLLLMYMCITAMIFLNGLIGIFGDAFYVVFKEVDPDEGGPIPGGLRGSREVNSINAVAAGPGAGAATGFKDSAAMGALVDSSRNVEVMLLALAQDNQALRADLRALRAEVAARAS